MTQLLIKLCALATLILAVRLALIPFYEPEHEQRVDELEKGSYATVFVGSSRTKCSIIPAYFDQLAQGRSGSSYNFGVDTATTPTLLDWSTKLIDRNPSLKHIFIEISGVDATILNDRVGPDSENGSKNIRSISKQFDKAILSIFRPFLPTDGRFFDHNRALEQLGEPCPHNEKVSDAEIRAAAERSRSIEQEFESRPKMEIAFEHKEQISRFLEHARSRGVAVRFFVPPLIPLGKEAESVGAIYCFLPPENKIAVNPDGATYSRETAADQWHLNQRGAFIFTRRFAEEFARR